MLIDLAAFLAYLAAGKRDIMGLINSFPSLFPDVPSRTLVIEHDICHVEMWG